MRESATAIPPEIRALVDAEDYRDRLSKADRGLSAALRAIHPDLDLIRVRSDIAPEQLPPGAVPGRWHVCKKNPVPFFSPITTPSGGYREPDSRILIELQKTDMRNGDVAHAVFERPRREAVKRQKIADLKKEQRKDEMVTDLKAGWRVAGSGGLRKRKWGAS